jgi:Rrf2 family protein
MRVSAKAQYACIAMLELARNFSEGQVVQIKAIADKHGISQRFLVQILLQLKVHGLVKSTRGASGGYQLTREPETVSLADVIQAIEQTTATQPPALGALRPSPAVHVISSVLQEVDARQRQLLQETTLADLLRRIEHSNEPSYQI